MLTIEKKRYTDFQKCFNKGDFGTMRYGQALHSYLGLSRINCIENRDVVEKLCQLDGEEAKQHIAKHFIFN